MFSFHPASWTSHGHHSSRQHTFAKLCSKAGCKQASLKILPSPVCQRRTYFPEVLADSPLHLIGQNGATWPELATERHPAGLAQVLKAGFASTEERGGIGGKVGSRKCFPQATQVLGIQKTLNLFWNFMPPPCGIKSCWWGAGSHTWSQASFLCGKVGIFSSI